MSVLQEANIQYVTRNTPPQTGPRNPAQHNGLGSNNWALKIESQALEACFSAELVQLFSKLYYVYHVLAQCITLCSDEQARWGLVPLAGLHARREGRQLVSNQTCYYHERELHRKVREDFSEEVTIKQRGIVQVQTEESQRYLHRLWTGWRPATEAKRGSARRESKRWSGKEGEALFL